MHSSLVRVQNIFGFFTTVAFVIAGLTALSVVLSPQSPSGSIQATKVQVVKGRPHHYSPKQEEYAHIKFDLEADFTSLFNWNTKQLFVYVLATYPSLSLSASPSQAIIWDTIIPATVPLTAQNLLGYIFDRSFVPASLRNQLFPGARSKSKRNARRNKSAVGSQIKEREARIIKLKNEKPKYHITDFSGHLAERGNVTLEVGWNVQPWVGALTWTISEGKKLGLWNGFIGGRSEAFDLPSLKGKKTSNSAAQATPASAGAVPIL